MRNLLILLILFSIPTISFAQINDDGKSSNTLKTKKGISFFNNSILYSAAMPYGPFGVKYHYCNSFGAYVSFKTDFEEVEGDYILTGGFAKSIGKNVNLYIGVGYDTYEDGVVEGGLILKFNRFAIDIGAGDVFQYGGYATIGFGYNF